MSLKIVEFFGKPPDLYDTSVNLSDQRCPFVAGGCRKQLHGSEVSGVCTLSAATDTTPVICCPYRLYANDYQVLKDVAAIAFGPSIQVQSPGTRIPRGEPSVRMFGKDVGGELRVPTFAGNGSYSVDWILAHVNATGDLQEFVAVEVQTIDTSGNYREQRQQILDGVATPSVSRDAGFNWENVNKRILPQLIYKGHVLRRERLCTKGLFFVCPTKVYDKAFARVGSNLAVYPIQSGAITFLHYGVGPSGSPRPLVRGGSLTTTVDQLAMAFSAPQNLPNAGVYEAAIRTAIGNFLA